MAERHYAGVPTFRPADRESSPAVSDEAPKSLPERSRLVFVLVDRDWRVVQLSETQAEVRDIERTPAAGRNLWDALGESEDSDFGRACHRAMDERAEARIERRDGDGSLTEVTAFPSGDGIAIISHDTTDAQELRRAVARAESEAESLVRHAPIGIYTISFHPPRFLSVNDAMCAMSGYTREELLSLDPVELLDPRSQAIFRERLRRTDGGETPPAYVEYTVRRKDGKPLLVGTHIAFTRDADGRIDGARVMGHDITELRRSIGAMKDTRARLEALSAVNAALLSAPDAAAAVQGIADDVMELLGCSLFLNYVVEDDGKALRLNAHSPLPSRIERRFEALRIGEPFCRSIAGDAGRVVLADLQSSRDPQTALLRSLGIQAYMCHPLTVGDRTVGTICFGTKTKTSFTQADLELVDMIANQISVALERTRTEQRLQHSEALLRTIVDNVHDGITLLDIRARKFRFVSQAQSELTGFSVEDFKAFTPDQYWERVHPDDRSMVMRRQADTARGIDVSGAIEYRWKVRDGEYRWFSDRLSVVRDPDGTPMAMTCVTRDITRTKRREKHGQLIVQLTDDFAVMTEEDDILSTVGERLAGHLGVSGVHLTAIDEQGDRITVRPMHVSHGSAEPRAYRLSEYLTPAFCGQARRGRTMVIRNADTDPRVVSDAQATSRSRAVISVPFVHGGRWQWLMSVSDGIPRDWRPDEIELVEDVAGRLFPRIQRARGDSQLKQSEARWSFVLELSDALRPLETPEEIEETACRLLLERLHATRVFYAAPGPDGVLAARRDFAVPGVAPMGAFPPAAGAQRIMEALDAGQGVAIADVAESGLLALAQKQVYADLGVRSCIDHPLRRGKRLVAVLGVHDSEQREWSDFERALLQETADRTWTAIERSTAMNKLRESLKRTTVLKELASAVASSLDPRQLAERALATARDLLGAETGNVYLLSAPEGPARAIATFGYPVAAPYIEEVPVDDSTMTGRAIMEGTVQVTHGAPPHATQRTMDLLGLSESQVAAVPLVLRGKVIGTVGLSFPDRRKFDEDDLDLFAALADQLVVGFENARLFETEHNIAETLQETLVVLPSRLRGVLFSRAYESATFERGRVGGDFVDVFEVHGHEIGVVMGDVSGKGVDAAVTTSLVRNTLRAHAVDGLTPAELCAKANKVMCRYMEPDEYVTLFFGLLSTRTGILRYVSAGHPPGLVLSPDDTIRELEANSPILGAFDYAPFRESSTILRRGERLVLYSDGVTEARSPEGGSFYNLGGLKKSLIRHRGTPVPGMADRLMDDVIRFSAGVLRDDAALLIVQPTKLRARAGS